MSASRPRRPNQALGRHGREDARLHAAPLPRCPGAAAGLVAGTRA